jgi:hypothetical protein
MDRARELSSQGLSNLLLGLAYAAAPLRAEVMARLLQCVRAVLLDEGRSATCMEQAIGNALYALAVLSSLGVHVEARTVEGLMRRAAGVPSISEKYRRQVCASSSSCCSSMDCCPVLRRKAPMKGVLQASHAWSCAQVYDAVACFQHAGVVVPAECVDAVSAFRCTVQSRSRMVLNRPGALHVALTQAVEELMQEAASPACIEACDSQALQCPSVHRRLWLLVVAECIMRAHICYFRRTSVSRPSCL